jgi:hypothetical protein
VRSVSCNQGETFKVIFPVNLVGFLQVGKIDFFNIVHFLDGVAKLLHECVADLVTAKKESSQATIVHSEDLEEFFLDFIDIELEELKS